MIRLLNIFVNTVSIFESMYARHNIYLRGVMVEAPDVTMAGLKAASGAIPGGILVQQWLVSFPDVLGILMVDPFPRG